MSELPKIRLNLSDGEFEATPENSHLYMHLGALACYNHVFLEKGRQEDNTLSGTYIFSITPVFDEMAEFMAENGYPMHVNLRTVAQCDVDAFNRMVEQQVGEFDSFPDEWVEDGTSQG